jgi:hypothetical protein
MHVEDVVVVSHQRGVPGVAGMILTTMGMALAPWGCVSLHRGGGRRERGEW